MTTAPRTFGETIINQAQLGSPWMWRNAVAMGLLSLIFLGLQFIDVRLLDGASVWMKPAKFYFSIAIHLATLSWAMMLLPPQIRHGRSVAIATGLFITASWIELIYMTYRAALGEASHFNVATPVAAFLYTMMAIGALTMTAVTGHFGVRLWRNRDGNLMTDAAAIGLILSAVLATVVGFYLGGQTSHWVGGDLTDATGTGFFGWSTTGGDMRVAHFIGLHAAQVVPLAALSGKRSIVYGAAVLVVVVTAATLAQALAGIPLFRG